MKISQDAFTIRFAQHVSDVQFKDLDFHFAVNRDLPFSFHFHVECRFCYNLPKDSGKIFKVTILD